ncbi:RDD family protein [Anaeromyxobacter diazotrophicus]|uniref:RDD domain-containing protein n=1 Tax=Anaeromyxobacter diazotrophicus TaxID=2590199 RepID=A0A7I9VT22_9BACT|nr:RDD family protein [Anaeromyxobacter diazotrophicus]GEJ59555.1 hypothetical protein AMYX_42960 [Anaeromyxobacter diazotrophicus]
MECPRCHELASPAALACAVCAAPLRLGEEPRPARLDRVLDLDRRARGRLDPLPDAPDEGEGAGGGDLDLDLDRERACDRDLDRDGECDRDREGDQDLDARDCGAAEEPETAPLGARLAAGFADGTLVALGVAAPVGLAAWAFPDGVSLWRGLFPAGLALGALAFVAYAALAHGLLGGTLGDRLLGLAVVERDGEGPGMGRAAARAALALLGTAALGAGTWLALFTSSPRALHDRAAGTFVVRAP